MYNTYNSWTFWINHGHTHIYQIFSMNFTDLPCPYLLDLYAFLWISRIYHVRTNLSWHIFCTHSVAYILCIVLVFTCSEQIRMVFKSQIFLKFIIYICPYGSKIYMNYFLFCMGFSPNDQKHFIHVLTLDLSSELFSATSWILKLDDGSGEEPHSTILKFLFAEHLSSKWTNQNWHIKHPADYSVGWHLVL